jgi:ribosome-binding protein aMBF1 (putative translation factor)
LEEDENAMAQEDFGQYVRRKRRELGLSQADLADDVLVSDSYIARIEVGERSPGPKTLSRIADVLQIPLEKLTALSASESKSTRVKLSDEVDRKLCSLPLRTKLALLEFAETMEK